MKTKYAHVFKHLKMSSAHVHIGTSEADIKEIIYAHVHIF